MNCRGKPVRSAGNARRGQVPTETTGWCKTVGGDCEGEGRAAREAARTRPRRRRHALAAPHQGDAGLPSNEPAPGVKPTGHPRSMRKRQLRL